MFEEFPAIEQITSPELSFKSCGACAAPSALVQRRIASINIEKPRPLLKGYSICWHLNLTHANHCTGTVLNKNAAGTEQVLPLQEIHWNGAEKVPG